MFCRVDLLIPADASELGDRVCVCVFFFQCEQGKAAPAKRVRSYIQKKKLGRMKKPFI